MNDKGFVRLYRSTLSSPAISKDSSSIAVWIYLVVNAAYQETDAIFDGKHITLKIGQLITTEKEICDKYKLNPSKVHRILASFKNEGLIEKRATNKNTLITVHDSPFCVASEKRNEKPVKSQRKTNEKTSYYKRIEEEKNAVSEQDDSEENWITPSDLKALMKGENDGTL